MLAHANRKGNKELLDAALKIPTKADFGAAEGEKGDSEMKTRKNYKLNKLAY